MPSTTPPEVVQPDQPTTALVGCLIDVSNSIRNVLETEREDERVIERLRAVLRAALKLARAEQRQNPNALMFLGAFELDNERTPAVDLCGLVDALLDGTNSPEDKRTGHELLIALANENNVAHVTQYIRTRLTEDQARVVHIHFQRHPEKIQEFVDAIPPPEDVNRMEEAAQVGTGLSTFGGAIIGAFAGPLGMAVGLFLHASSGKASTEFAKNRTVDNSGATKLARRICDEWLLDFKDLIPRPISDVVPLLERTARSPFSWGKKGSRRAHSAR